MTTGQFQPPSPLAPTALIDIDSADHAVNNALPGSPSREVMRQAISTAYYAVIHAVNASNADSSTVSPRTLPLPRLGPTPTGGCATASQPETSADTCST